MKTLSSWCCLVLICVLPLLCACSATPNSKNSEPLLLLKGPMTLTGTLTVGESDFGIELHSADGSTGTVSFTAPDSMKGYVFEKADDGYYVSYDDLRVPLKSGTIPGGAGILFSLLSPNITNIDTSEEEANGLDLIVYTFPLGADGRLRVYTKKSDGTPLRAEFDSSLGSGVFHISEAKFE